MKAKISSHIGIEHFRTEIKAGSNLIISDEPESVGGKNLGFSPSELLSAALAACTSATVRMYADHKGWDLTAIDVKIKFEKEDNTDHSKFTRNIQLIGNLDETQRKRLLTVANSCPIHKVLSNPIEISTKLTD